MSDKYIELLNRMKARIETEADKREGTWTADNLQAVANELARIYDEDIDTILPQAFVMTASGENLDNCCNDYGITRREATAAEVLVELSGDIGAYAEGIQLYADEISFTIPQMFIIPQDGTVTVRAVCDRTGDIGNVAAGSIDTASSPRITRISNPEAAAGGYDIESDEALRERTLEHIRTPANSGNIAHYVQWAKEVSGVAKVRVYDLARGPGTVDVVIIADNNQVAPQKLLEAVEDNIEEQRPIGADVQVLSGEAVDINIETNVIVEKGYTAESIKNNFYALLVEHCEDIAFQSQIISYLGMVNLLFSCPGVIDVSDFILNGMSKSLYLSERQFPVAQPPQVTISEEAVTADAIVEEDEDA